MESCPHCSFLVRDGSTSCGVCGRPLQLAGTTGTPGPSATVRTARVGPAGGSTTPVAAVALLMLILCFGAAAAWVALGW